MENTTVRTNIRMSVKVKAYFDRKSKDTGVPRSCLMVLALEEYIDQKMTMELMNSGKMEELLALGKNSKVLE